MTDLAIIGGTGLTSLPELEITRREVVYTPYGQPSGPMTHGRLGGRDIVFLPRHGYGHTIPPHKVNYRANIWALKNIGVGRILAVASVGGIRSDMAPGRIAFPAQILDYTYGRDNTYFEENLEHVTHIDFTWPYDEELRGALLKAAEAAQLEFAPGGVYGAMQGPRLETAAEVNRLERDGCDMIGMTGMPETALARELGLAYACCAVVANWAAGRGDKPIHDELKDSLRQGMEQVGRLLAALMPLV
ncbi:MAG TPA: S-methyl-5'-thioinosine phosphorylase [Gammaproteobacteria bacterium]|nr:S-methyl-5'-thioinosine phosphorylase [Gammaproteobacteria bacterium]